jgi:DNA-binding NarL/FixJ family response regulator
MAILQLLVESPEDMSLSSLRELLEMNHVIVREVKRTEVVQTSLHNHSQTSTPLTPTELAVLKAFTYCDTNEDIARRLGVQASTVKKHVENIFAKLNVNRRAFAVGRALRLGLLNLRDLVPPSPPYGEEKYAKRRRDLKGQDG